MPQDSPLEIKLTIALSSQQTAGFYKEALDIVTTRCQGRMLFNPKTFDGSDLNVSLFFPSKSKVKEFQDSCFIKQLNEFIPLNWEPAPEANLEFSDDFDLENAPNVIAYHVGIIPEVLLNSERLHQEVIFLPRASLELGSILFLARGLEVAKQFEAQILAYARQHLREAAEWQSDEYLRVIERRGKHLLRASLIPSPQGPR